MSTDRKAQWDPNSTHGRHMRAAPHKGKRGRPMVMGMEDIERATTLKKSGLSYRQISDLMHIHPATLHRNLRGRV